MFLRMAGFASKRTAEFENPKRTGMGGGSYTIAGRIDRRHDFKKRLSYPRCAAEHKLSDSLFPPVLR
jgi:hypothetical protein